MNRMQVIIIALVVFGFSILGYGLRQAQDASNQAHEGICAIKNAYEDSIKGTKKYLAQHPHGDIAGVSRKVIIRSLHQNEKRLAALKKVQCSK